MSNLVVCKFFFFESMIITSHTDSIMGLNLFIYHVFLEDSWSDLLLFNQTKQLCINSWKSTVFYFSLLCIVVLATWPTFRYNMLHDDVVEDKLWQT